MRIIDRGAIVLVSLAACMEAQPVSGSTSRHRVVETRWGLRGLLATRIDHEKSETVTIRFGVNGHIDGTATCNLVGGTGLKWSARAGENGGDIAHDVTQPMIQTLVGCGDTRQSAVATRFWLRMEHAKDWSLRTGTLTITFDDGGVAELVPIAAASKQRPSANSDDPSHNFDLQ